MRPRSKVPTVWLGAAVFLGQLVSTPAIARDYPPFRRPDVGSAADCSPSPALERVLGLLEGPPLPFDPDAPPDFDEPLANAVSANMRHVLELDAPVDWHGLALVRIETFYGFERGPQNTSLVFRNDSGEVRRVWNVLGWNLPAAGSNRTIDDEVIEVLIGVQDLGGGLAAVTCFRD